VIVVGKHKPVADGPLGRLRKNLLPHVRSCPTGQRRQLPHSPDQSIAVGARPLRNRFRWRPFWSAITPGMVFLFGAATMLWWAERR